MAFAITRAGRSDRTSFRARRLRDGQVCITPTLSVIGIHAATTAAPVLAEIAAQR